MSENYGHARLESRHVLRGELVCETAVHVGTGGSSDVLSTTDMPVARDGAGRPYVPGSSLRGALRSGLEALLRGLNRSEEELSVCDPLQKRTEGDAEEKSCANRILASREKEKKLQRGDLSEEAAFRIAWGESCAICLLFGNSFLASRVWIGDLRLLSDSGEVATYLRDGVGIDRDLRSAARNVLYSFEAVPAGARFELRLEVENAADHELGLLLTGLELFDNGFLAIGGKRARGLGTAKIENLSMKRFKARDFFDGTAGRELTEDHLTVLRSAARDHYIGGQN